MSYNREQYLDDIANKRWCQFVPKWERPVLTALIKAELEQGNTLSIHDGEEWVVKKSSELNLIRSQLGHTGEDVLRVRNDKGEALGSWSFIYNNGSEHDPMTVISDYGWTDGNEDHFDKIWNKLEERGVGNDR